jgi:hypothetical protein
MNGLVMFVSCLYLLLLPNRLERVCVDVGNFYRYNSEKQSMDTEGQQCQKPELAIADQNGQTLNNTFCSVSRDRELLAAFLKESWRLHGKATVFFPRFEQTGGAR